MNSSLPSCHWLLFSRKVAACVENPKSVGFFSEEEALAKGLRLVIGEEGNHFVLFWLVDPVDGVIADAKYQVFGGPILIALAEATCTLLIHKNYGQARRMSGDLIEKQLQDKVGIPAFPAPYASDLNLILAAVENAAEKCADIPFNTSYIDSPIEPSFLEEGSVHPGWEKMSIDQKLVVIEQVIAADIRPYIELDAGGVQVLNLIDDRELVIAYQGSCTSCHSATGATLNAIQQILRAKVHPEIVVVPDLSFLT